MQHPHLLILLCGLGFAQATRADITLEYQATESAANPAKLQRVIVKDGRILARSIGGDGSMDLIYSSSPEWLAAIDHRKRSVMSLDEEQINRFAKQSEAVQPLLQGLAGQIAKLDAKQRAKWEDMLGGNVSLGKIAAAVQPMEPSTIVKTGKGRKVAGIACEEIKVFQGKAQTAELCLAEPAKLKMSGRDYATLRSLLDFSERLAAKTQGLAKQFGMNIPHFDLRMLPGVPVELRAISSHDQDGVRLNSIDASSVSAELMRIPEGYRTEPFKLWK